LREKATTAGKKGGKGGVNVDCHGEGVYQMGNRRQGTTKAHGKKEQWMTSFLASYGVKVVADRMDVQTGGMKSPGNSSMWEEKKEIPPVLGKGTGVEVIEQRGKGGQVGSGKAVKKVKKTKRKKKI